MDSMPRLDYEGPALDEARLAPTPLHTINRWIGDAVQRQEDVGDIIEPGALYLATVDPAGMPSVRTVLLRFLDERGPGFVTHSTSRKVADLESHPQTSALLSWLPLFRQIRFYGVAERIADDEIEEYWRTRPRGAQIAAAVVRQSEPTPSRAAMEEQFAAAEQQFGDAEIPLPDTFVGYRIRCSAVELWSGRNHRLHDRLLLTNPSDLSLADPGWKVTRLQP